MRTACAVLVLLASAAIAFGQGAETAIKLWETYGENELAADKKYKGKQIVFEGRVDSIRKDENGRYYIGFIGVKHPVYERDQFAALSPRERNWYLNGFPPTVLSYIPKDGEDEFVGVEKGATLRVRAKAIGLKRADVWGGYVVELEDCRLVK